MTWIILWAPDKPQLRNLIRALYKTFGMEFAVKFRSKLVQGNIGTKFALGSLFPFQQVSLNYSHRKIPLTNDIEISLPAPCKLKNRTLKSLAFIPSNRPASLKDQKADEKRYQNNNH